MTRSEKKFPAQTEWEKEISLRRTLIGPYGSDFAALAGSLTQLHRAFYRDEKGKLRLKDRGVKCIDEGTPGGVHIAGCGILYGIDQTVAMLSSIEPDTVHSHDDCGGARKYAADHGIDADNTDILGQEFAAAVADRIGAKHHHIRREQLRRPPSRHTATVVYYSGVKAFAPDELPELPKGFTITRALHLSPISARDEVAFTCQIAFGPHGFGERFTAEDPFIVVPVGNPHNSPLGVAALTAELQSLTKLYGRRLQISPFQSPF